MRLTAVKPMRRGGVPIEPGGSFEVRSASEARVLKALGKATDYVDQAVFHQQQQDAERDALRAKAETLGVDVDGRWGVDRLNEEIAAAEQRAASRAPRQTETRAMEAETESTPQPPTETAADGTVTRGNYQRRDMRARE